MKGHPMMLLAPATDRPRVKPAFPEICVPQANTRLGFDIVAQRSGPFSGPPRELQREASFAGTKSMRERLLRGGEEPHVPTLRLAGRARGSAKDPRGLHGRDENAVVLRVSTEKRIEHFILARERALDSVGRARRRHRAECRH